jgi:hypothetical protein
LGLIYTIFDGHTPGRLNRLTGVFDVITEKPEKTQQAAVYSRVQDQGAWLG